MIEPGLNNIFCRSLIPVYVREPYFVLAYKTVGIVSTDTAKITLRPKKTMTYLQQASIHKHSLI